MSHPLISTPQPNFHFSPPKKNKMIGPHPIITKTPAANTQRAFLYHEREPAGLGIGV